ncbi:MAG: hypothetical protein R8M11_04735 [Gallionella sp.]
MSYLSKEILSAIAIAITLVAFLPYIRSIIKGVLKPHVFSWIIWGTTTFVVFLAQLDDNGGAGAWAIGFSACLSILIALLAFLKRSDISITKIDWMFLVMAMSSLPFWYFTSDPMWAVVILTVVDLLGFGPTIRKAYNFPLSESPAFFGLFATRNLIVIMALENHTVTTVLFPAAIALASISLITMIVYRRQAITR